MPLLPVGVSSPQPSPGLSAAPGGSTAAPVVPGGAPSRAPDASHPAPGPVETVELSTAAVFRHQLHLLDTAVGRIGPALAAFARIASTPATPLATMVADGPTPPPSESAALRLAAVVGTVGRAAQDLGAAVAAGAPGRAVAEAPPGSPPCGPVTTDGVVFPSEAAPPDGSRASAAPTGGEARPATETGLSRSMGPPAPRLAGPSFTQHRTSPPSGGGAPETAGVRPPETNPPGSTAPPGSGSPDQRLPPRSPYAASDRADIAGPALTAPDTLSGAAEALSSVRQHLDVAPEGRGGAMAREAEVVRTALTPAEAQVLLAAAQLAAVMPATAGVASIRARGARDPRGASGDAVRAGPASWVGSAPGIRQDLRPAALLCGLVLSASVLVAADTVSIRVACGAIGLVAGTILAVRQRGRWRLSMPDAAVGRQD